MIGVADPERFFIQRAEQADLREAEQGNGQHEQRCKHSERTRILLRVKMRENRHDGEQVANEVAAGVAEKSAGVRKIPRQKSDQRAAHEKARDGDEVFAVRGGDERENKRANRSDTGAQPVHVVHEVEGVDHGKQPENRDGVAENVAVDKQRDTLAGGGHGHGDENLADEFWERLQLVLVVEPAENRDGDRAEREHGEFNRAAVNAVDNQAGGGNFDDAEFQENCADGERQENSRQHGKTAGERNRGVVNFAVAGIVHEVGAQAPFTPLRQREQRGHERAQKGGGKKIEGKGHGEMTND